MYRFRRHFPFTNLLLESIHQCIVILLHFAFYRLETNTRILSQLTSRRELEAAPSILPGLVSGNRNPSIKATATYDFLRRCPYFMISTCERNQQKNFILFYFLSYISFGIVMSNFTPFLSQLGYNQLQRGVLLSAYAITTILFQLLFGVFADRYQTMKKMILVSITVFALCSTVLFFQTGTIFALHLCLIALSGGLLNTLCGLYDTWVLSTSQHFANRLSFMKAFGSIGWALGSSLASYLLLALSYQGMAISICLIMGLAIFSMHALPDIKKLERKKKTSSQEVFALVKDPKYIGLIVILFLLYSMVVANNCTVIDKMLALGASQGDISLKWSLQSLLEIPTYLLGSRILRRFSSIGLLQFSAGMLILQFGLFAFTDSLSLMILLSVFQLFSTPLLLITSKTFINQISKPELKGSSQLIALSLFTGCSSFMIPTLAGSLSMSIGLNATLLCVMGLGIIAFLLLVLFKKSFQGGQKLLP